MLSRAISFSPQHLSPGLRNSSKTICDSSPQSVNCVFAGHCYESVIGQTSGLKRYPGYDSPAKKFRVSDAASKSRLDHVLGCNKKAEVLCWSREEIGLFSVGDL